MTKLTKDQLYFLRSQNIEFVFDAAGMSKKHYSQEMRDRGLLVAIGVIPCAKSGHTMRTRAGHCAQCKTENLGFLRRYEESNYIYVASSKQGNCIKVGMPKDTYAREETLNKSGYGGVCDWVIQYKIFCESAGRVEQRIHDVLSRHHVQRSYVKLGFTVDCQELFDCCVADAVAAIESAIKI